LDQPPDLRPDLPYILAGIGDIGYGNGRAQAHLPQIFLHQLSQVAVNYGLLRVIRVNGVPCIAINTVMHAMPGARRGDIDDPAMVTLPPRVRIRKIMKS
jgi:hypothetical protein